MADTPRPPNDGVEDEVGQGGDDDGPATGAVHGENHLNRHSPKELQSVQGNKTRAANRERVKGSRQFNP
jgi:hypothetical protein